MLEAIASLIRRKDVCVLATTAGNIPHCSLMDYLAAPDAGRLYFLSSRQTRKYANILRNTQVSVLIDSRGDMADPDLATALTLEATCAPMAEGTAKEETRQQLVARHPHLQSLAADPEADVLECTVEACLLCTGAMETYFEKISSDNS